MVDVAELVEAERVKETLKFAAREFLGLPAPEVTAEATTRRHSAMRRSLSRP